MSVNQDYSLRRGYFKCGLQIALGLVPGVFSLGGCGILSGVRNTSFFILMGIWRSISIKLGLADLRSGRAPISVFLLDDDERRHRWFRKKFVNDELDITDQIEEAKEYLSNNRYDAIFLDHDLIPEHY